MMFRFQGFVVSMAIAAGTGLAGRATAEPEKNVHVTVALILGSEKPGDTDKKIECVAKVVRKTEPALKSFRLARTWQKDLALNGSADVPLVEGQVMPLSIEKPGTRVSLTVKPPTMGEISYDSACGKYFPIITRYETKEHERLIVLIKVQCNREDDH